MTGQTIAVLKALLEQTGVAHLSPGNLIMIIIGSAMIYLAIVGRSEPLLLIGIGFACIVANVPGPPDDIPGSHAISSLLYQVKEGDLFYYAYQGVAKLIIPPLIFFGVGAMTDFGPMIANPKLVILGAGSSRNFRCADPCEAGGVYLEGSLRSWHYWRRRRTDGDFHNRQACATSLGADFGCGLFLHGVDADDPAANYASSDNQKGTLNRHGAASQGDETRKDRLPAGLVDRKRRRETLPPPPSDEML